MIEKTNFKSKNNKEELLSNASVESLLHCLYADDDSLIGGAFPWHWHTAFEIDYIEGCDMQFDFTGTSVFVPQGNAIFINSGEIHSYRALGKSPCKIIAFIFEPVFLAGSYSDKIYTQYIAPILNAGLTYTLISPDLAKDRNMILNIENMIQLASDEPDCYEIMLRSELGNFWCGLMDSLKSMQEIWCSENRDRKRIKTMLEFIHSNYMHRISLKEIAESALIGPRECSRCFGRSIGRPPMVYLNYYRIQMAIQQLITTDKNVTEISECNGFSSISYFGKVFKEHTGLSPLQYRASVQREQR
ncbi:MAG: helix-turn-helix domain-containing protein [Monoglobaceae bacterium]